MRITLVLLFSLAMPSFAETPPHWAPFEVHSENRRFVAKVDLDGPKAKAPKGPWRLTVMRTAQGAQPAKRMWHMPFVHTGFRGCLLTDDGMSLVRNRAHFREEGWVLEVYNNGKLLPGIHGKALRLQKDKVPQQPGPLRWLKSQKLLQEQADGKPRYVLRLGLADGRKARVDLATGALSFPTP